MRFWKDRKKTDGGDRLPRLLAAALAAAALAIPGGFAGAAEGAAADNAVSRLDPVEVTATRVERKVSEQAASVTVIGREEIEAKMPVVAGDVLQAIPGIHVQQVGSVGNLQSIRIRGARSTDTLVLIDGFPVNTPTGGIFDISSLPVDDFDRIEVVRGPQSALYGSNAMGGVVNFLPRTGKDGTEGTAGLALGSHDTFRWNGSGQGSGRAGTIHLGATGLESGGISANDDTSMKSILASGESRAGAFGKVHGIVLSTEEDKGIPVTYRAWPGSTDPNADRTRRDFLAGLRWEAPLPDRFALSVSGAFFNEFLDYRELPAAAFPYWDSYTIRTDRALLRTDGRVRLADRIDLFAGAEYTRDRARDLGEGFAQGFPPFFPDYSYSSFVTAKTLSRSAWLQLEGGPFHGVGASLGLRGERNSEAGTKWVPRFSAYANVVPGLVRVRGAYGQGFRVPTVLEKSPDMWGNPNLSPESSWSWEGGADLTPGGGHLRLSGTYFYQGIRGMIAYSGGSLVNVNEALSRGAEFEAACSFTNFEGSLFYTFDDAVDSTRGSRIDSIPRHRVGTVLALRPAQGARIQAEWTIESDQVDLDPRNQRQRRPGYGRVDLHGRYGWDAMSAGLREVALTGKVENLLNREYEERVGYPAPGISFLAGVEAKI